jgi:hypothetical protein
MTVDKINNNEYPGLFQSADAISGLEQKKYFNGIGVYTMLLIIASGFTYYLELTENQNEWLKIISALLFLLSLGILIWLRVEKPEAVWYNGRAVAESVKTRSWRFMTRAEPYEDAPDIEIIKKQFIQDLRSILKQNQTVFSRLPIQAYESEPISSKMYEVRALPLMDRLSFYKEHRIQDQATWYAIKSALNKKKSRIWFWVTVCLHAVAIVLLLVDINGTKFPIPIETFATMASGILSWMQSKKYNELSASYSLTAHDIMLLKAEDINISSEKDLSEHVLNCENAFSREHTQWVARKTE